MDLKFDCTSEPRGDACADYTITSDGNYTLGEYIDNVLTRGEWGYIYCLTTPFEKTPLLSLPKYLEYNQDKIIKGKRSPIIDKKKVKSIHSSGGWSRMDYYFEL